MSEGGVGLKDIKETNMANLAFLVYRVSQQASPWATLVKGRYCERKGLLDSSLRGKRVSRAWRMALRSWCKVKEQVGWRIGNGALAKFWTDHWGADRLIDKIPISHLHLVQDCIPCSVKEIIETNGEYIRGFLTSLNIHASLPTIQVEQLDVLTWRNDNKGEITRRDIWQQIRKKGIESNDNMLVWKGRRLPRAVWVVYLGCAGRIPTDKLVKKQGRHLASRCYIWKQASEDISHLFFDCKGARPIWACIYGKFGRTAPWNWSPQSLKQGLIKWHKQGFKDKTLDKCWKDSFHLGIWFIWKTRNQFKHRGDITIGNVAKIFWSHCCEHWWTYQWTISQRVKTQNWLCTGILWNNGVNRADTWVEISITSLFMAAKKGVAGLVRDTAGRFRHGLACWFGNISEWWETEILMECIGYLVNLEDNQGHIYILANSGDWKQHYHSALTGRRTTDTNPMFSSLLNRIVFCRRWPLAEATNLLMSIPDNGMYTKWTPTDDMWDPFKETNHR
ncbi:putative ribonuclease H protein [Nymphaea thermarum]|nr:putative ribonuclease H protein [Nymphaea thermarum]